MFVRDRNAELVFERHHQFDEIERIGLQVVDKLACPGDVVRIFTELLRNDLDDLFFHRHAQFLHLLQSRISIGNRASYTSMSPSRPALRPRVMGEHIPRGSRCKP